MFKSLVVQKFGNGRTNGCMDEWTDKQTGSAHNASACQSSLIWRHDNKIKKYFHVLTTDKLY